jgi:hypothetical protein
LFNRDAAVLTTARKKKIRATVAKEVGMKNPAEETTVRPNQIQKSSCREPDWFDPVSQLVIFEKEPRLFPTTTATVLMRLFNQNQKPALLFLATS